MIQVGDAVWHCWAASGEPHTVNQQVFADRDIYVSARDQKIEVRNYRQPGE